ncbi:MAG TPA: sigma-70 family RNA polymerase sigma factor [Planctomycetes bacterium]|nr:sigma-70 family RNA polymerase sigma factor [Planctomycetota bacterium]HIK60659.1 sigma-70 family RNA polymerase sigma factor [Planctomycetota bacterium]
MRSVAAPRDTTEQAENSDCGAALDWRRYLCGGGPAKVILRLAQGDPLGLRSVVGVRLARRSLLLDADWVHLRTMTRIALASRSYEGSPPFAHWLETQVDAAIEEVLDEEREFAGSSSSTQNPEGCSSHQPAVHRALGDPLGIDPDTSRRVCVALNGLPYQERHTFSSLVLSGEDLDQVAAELGSSASRVARRVRRVLDHLLAVAHKPPTKSQP